MTFTKPVVGLHDFLNSKPLLHPIRHGLLEAPFRLEIDTPAALADRFATGDLDMALIPSIEYARIPDAVIVPVVCIASLGRVETVLLFSDMAVEDIESVAVDPKSRTSVAMLQIIFKERFNKDVTIVKGLEDDPEMLLKDADAGLVIGDAAYSVDHDRHVVLDLGELWFQYSGRPFVHALLCCHRGEKWEAATAALQEAKEMGVEHRELVARQEAKNPQEAQRMIDYLMGRIFYNMGERELDGLRFFLEEAKKLGLCTRDELEFA
ncbi:MAG: menaquinone biosynthesis protein [Nitrospinota bacterium]|nr:menaquinone biosynthesis protein [Nitrospinota bacterium]MDH5677546.1 menaquinone biosynthesis protein [Nitrospinota bacterium]MDH5755833.1 menaquinone biosynthesis protein [Nitrospinota bacterium]